MNIIGFWVTYAALAVPVFALLFIWALRAGQFRNQDRARTLPFHDDLEPASDAGKAPMSSWAPLLVIACVAASMIAAAWISAAHPALPTPPDMTGGQ